MIYLLYGENTYFSKEKLAAIRQKFLATNPPDNLIIRSAHDLSVAGLPELFFAQTLLGGKRLVVIEDALGTASDEVKHELVKILKQAIPDDLTVIFRETGKIDARESLFKLLNQPKQAQEFIAPSAAALTTEANQMAQARGLKLSQKQSATLSERSGGDLWQLHNEIDKLSAAKFGQTVSDEVFEAIASGDLSDSSFALVDAIMNRQPAAASRALWRATNHGENDIKMLGSIIYQLRILLRVSELVAQGRSLADIARAIGAHPFVVRKAAARVNRFDRSRLIATYQTIVRLDRQIKTGAVDSNDALDILTTRLSAG
ncbi:MAG: DNA polymerase III subunit delta [bacterium]